LRRHNSVTATNVISIHRRPARQRVAQHSFLLPANGIIAHEPDHFPRPRRQVVWTYAIRSGRGRRFAELGDATMLSNGNVVFCRKVGASEVTPDKKSSELTRRKKRDIPQPSAGSRARDDQWQSCGKVLLINTTRPTEKEYTFPVDPGANRTSNSAGCVRRRRDVSRGALAGSKVVEMTRTSRKLSTRAKYPWMRPLRTQHVDHHGLTTPSGVNQQGEPSGNFPARTRRILNSLFFRRPALENGTL